MKRKFISSIAISMAISTGMPIYASAMPNLDGLDNTEKLQVLDNEIVTSMNDIDNLKKEIKNAETEIDTKEKALIDNQKAYDAQKDAVSLKSNNSNKGNSLKILDILLGSNSIGDLLQNIEISKALLKENNKTLKNIDLKESQLEELKNSIINEKHKLEEDKSKLENETKELEQMKDKVKEQIKVEEKAKEEREKALALENANRTANPAINPMLASKANINVGELPNIQASGNSKTVIDNAMKYLGVPYVWGGTTPSGFDCSGFTSYVFRTVGVSLPRIACDQQQFGKQVPLNQLQPGDLIFMGYPAHHVGIYIGNGKYIHAPHTGDVVKISDMAYSSFSSASRVL